MNREPELARFLPPPPLLHLTGTSGLAKNQEKKMACFLNFPNVPLRSKNEVSSDVGNNESKKWKHHLLAASILNLFSARPWREQVDWNMCLFRCRHGAMFSFRSISRSDSRSRVPNYVSSSLEPRGRTVCSLNLFWLWWNIQHGKQWTFGLRIKLIAPVIFYLPRLFKFSMVVNKIERN